MATLATVQCRIRLLGRGNPERAGFNLGVHRTRSAWYFGGGLDLQRIETIVGCDEIGRLERQSQAGHAAALMKEKA
ncbi:hypothetical protein N7509_012804 [Penicillium cosmopolitanum]|uniref:Uncharacterized protein n=1 Tax=Penicillium cosmopolitanum TaxID=1131564 RepID=A0A9W9SC46_9EURO|nr:uncharacterized protein N7509_012804 [Penicillium cosmopolitanum]KAJ5375918.1 hypothetical protein N7509_012804 [Penicillium cosmopolitanum]